MKVRCSQERVLYLTLEISYCKGIELQNWTDHGNGAILTSGRLSIALIMTKELVSIFDLNFRNKEGCQVLGGKAVLLEFFSLQIYF